MKLNIGEKIGVALFIIGFFMAVIGMCALDSKEYYMQIAIFTMIGFTSMGIGMIITGIYED